MQKQIEVSEKVSKKFEEITKLNVDSIIDSQSNVNRASFEKFSVTDDVNLKLLSAQVFSGNIKLQTTKKFDSTITKGKPVFMFMIKDSCIKSFYKAYVVIEDDKKAPAPTKTSLLDLAKSKIKPEKKETVKPVVKTESKPNDDLKNLMLQQQAINEAIFKMLADLQANK